MWFENSEESSFACILNDSSLAARFDFLLIFSCCLFCLLFCLFRVQTDNRITIGSQLPSHENVDLRSGLPLLGGRSWSRAHRARKKIFFSTLRLSTLHRSLPVHHRPCITDRLRYVSAGAESSVCLAFPAVYCTVLTVSNMSAPLYSYSTSPWKCLWPSKASCHPRPFLSCS